MSEITSQPHPTAPASPEGITATPAPVVSTARAFPLHPNFWWAILWCVFLMLVTQVPGAIVGVAVMVVLALRDPSALQDMQSPAIAVGITVAVVVAHGLMILLSVVVLRVVAGRDWTRQVALRLPSFTHVLLALAMLPAFMILGSAAHEALKRVRLLDGSPLFPGMERPDTVVAFWAGLVVAIAVVGFGHLLCRIVGGRDWYHDWIGSRPRQLRVALSAALLIGFVALVTLGYHASYPLAAEVAPPASEFAGMEDMVKTFTSMPLLAAVVVIGVFPGLSEELWCRAFLGRGLVGKYGLFWGVLATSFFFGAIHADPRQGTMALLMGVLLHFAYQMSRSLLIPMLLHFLNNSLSITLARFREVERLESAEVEVVWPMLAASALLLAACLWAFWQTRARVVGQWQPPHPGVECPPLESGSVVLAQRTSWGARQAVIAAGTLFALACYWVVVQLFPDLFVRLTGW